MNHPCLQKIQLLGLALVSLAVVADAASRNLVEDSPFLPPGYQTAKEKAKKPPPPKAVPKKPAELVLKAYTRIGGVWRFCIMDKKSSKSRWLVQGEEPPSELQGLVINNFDEDGFLAYTYNGQSGELELARPSSSPATIQTGGGSKNNRPKSIPNRSSVPRPTPPRPSTPKVVSKPEPAKLPSVMVGGTPARTNTTSAAPNSPPSTPAPSFIPKLPANISAGLPGALSNAMQDAEDRGQATSVKIDFAKPNAATPGTPTITVTPATPSATPAEPTAPVTPSVFTNPGTAVMAPPTSPATTPTMIPRRTSLNLPPGIPPPPTTAPPSLPDFLRVGGPPPTPPPSGKP